MTRDLRDPQELGSHIHEIVERSDLTILEAADLLDNQMRNSPSSPRPHRPELASPPGSSGLLSSNGTGAPETGERVYDEDGA